MPAVIRLNKRHSPHQLSPLLYSTRILLYLESFSFEALSSCAHPLFPSPQIQLRLFVWLWCQLWPSVYFWYSHTIYSCCPTVHWGAELSYKRQMTCLSQEERNFMLFSMSSYVPALFQIISAFKRSEPPVSRSLKTLLGVHKALLKFLNAPLGPFPLAVFYFALRIFPRCPYCQVSFSMPLSRS